MESLNTVVLAGGIGSRLQERVSSLPKPMASVAGRPFLEYILDRLVAAGLRDIVLSVGYRADAIQAHFGVEYRNAALSYAAEGEPLGTGGAVVHALAGRGGDAALVVNGDTLLDIDYGEFIAWYRRAPARAALAIRKMPDTGRYGSVLVSGECVTDFVEKGTAGPGYINAGVYILQPAIFEEYGLSGTFSLERDLLQRHCARLSPRAFQTDAYFIDIGIAEDYDRAQTELFQAAQDRGTGG